MSTDVTITARQASTALGIALSEVFYQQNRIRDLEASRDHLREDMSQRATVPCTPASDTTRRTINNAVVTLLRAGDVLQRRRNLDLARDCQRQAEALRALGKEE